jgi:hypothetical protein
MGWGTLKAPEFSKLAVNTGYCWAFEGEFIVLTSFFWFYLKVG